MQHGLFTRGLTLWPLTMLEAELVLLWPLAARSHQLSPEGLPWYRTCRAPAKPWSNDRGKRVLWPLGDILFLETGAG